VDAVPGRLIELEAAREIVLEAAAPLGSEEVGLRDCLGRVLTETVLAPEDVPAFDNSAMDGFAVRAADTGAGARLRIVGESRAGTPAQSAVGEGEACAISTGAAIPRGADAVIRVEDTRREDDLVELAVAVERGRDLRAAGSDLSAGSVVLEAGIRVGAAEIGLLASAARARVSVGRRPRVAVVTTGDELVGVDEPLRPGAVRNSGSYVIPALVEGAGGTIVSVEHARDDPAVVTARLAAALAADVAVVTGGMSVGVHDHVDDALRELGVTTRFHGVALRPGKPTSFGTRGATLVFGLPGNPVSSLITFLLFARPALRALAGEVPRRARTFAILDEDCELTPQRLHAVRCGVHLEADGWHAQTTGPQSSHILSSMRGADAIALLPAGEGTLAAGSRVEIELLES
jgi:molybdopterin molybdotransferase